jgi:TRAP-type transport system small permease protein
MRRQIELFEAGFNRLIHFLAAMTAASIGLYAVLIPLNLLLIKTHLGNMWWLYEGIEYALYIGAFMGAPWVLQQGAHVRVDVLLLAIPKEAAVKLDRFLNLFGAGLCLFLCLYGVRATISEFQDGTVPDKVLQIKNWYMMSIFAMSFLLLAIEFLLRLRHTEAAEEIAPSEAGF